MMKRKPEGWNIVLAGIWNRAIFSPEWIATRVFKNETELETLISLMPHMPIIYRNEKVAIEIMTARVALRPRQLNDDCISTTETMGHAILSSLPETPLTGVGVNFAYVEESPPAALLDLFNLGDDNDLTGDDGELKERRLTRRLKLRDDVLNLTLIYDNQNVTIEFNFHTETNSNPVACDALNNRVSRLRDKSLELLENVYQLTLEDEDNADD